MWVVQTHTDIYYMIELNKLLSYFSQNITSNLMIGGKTEIHEGEGNSLKFR